MTNEPTVRQTFTLQDHRRALLLALLALLVYLALAQNLLHGLDAYHYLRSLHQQQLRHPRTFFYLPLAAWWSKLLLLFGVQQYEALRALSAVGAAAGIYCVHLAALRLGFDRARATIAALGCAATPAVLYTASVVEVDALLFGCSCLCWLPLAKLLTTGRATAAVATGLATALAAGFHAAGHLLAGTVLAIALAWNWPARRLRVTAPRALVFVATHGLASLLLALAAQNTAQAAMAANTLQHALQPDFVARALVEEWLLPYLPFAALMLLGFWRRDLRPAAAAVSACLCGYLAVTALVLGFQRATAPHLPQGDILERGSFLLGVTVPMVLLAVLSLPRRLAAVAVVVAALSGVLQVRLRDWPADPPGYAEGLGEVLAHDKVYLLVADSREWAWVTRRHPEVDCKLISEPVALAREQRQRGVEVQPELVFQAWLAIEYNRARDTGRSFVVTARALEAMRESPEGALAATMPLLTAAYDLEPLSAPGFSGYRLRRR